VGAVLCVALVLAPVTRAADKDAIDRAVHKAAAYLKSQQTKAGTWPIRGVGSSFSDNDGTIGATALCALALLEGDVPREDPALQAALQAVRQQSITTTATYALSLEIMFLDRFGDPADAELIESMAVRLLAGQTPGGGWTYQCPPLNAEEVRRLQQQLQQRPQLVAKDPPQQLRGKGDFKNLTPQIQQQVRAVEGGRGGAGPVFSSGGDNSNTQFAVLALWIARRQGIPVEAALKRIEDRFHGTQNADGGWSYIQMPPNMGRGGPPMMMNGPGMGSTPAMTCAGLLGLALGHGSAMESTLRAGLPGSAPAPRRQRDIGDDKSIKAGIAFLGKSLDVGAGTTQPAVNGPGFPPGPGGPGGPPGFGRQPDFGGLHGKRYYFLFSLERVCVAYGLDTIGGKDWYAWGSDLLLRSQLADGSWLGQFTEGGSDTCFGILFLRRANLAVDLTASLKGKVRDVTLKGGVDVKELDRLNKGPRVGASGRPEEPNTTPPGRPAPAETRPKSPAAEARPAAEPKLDPEVSKLSDELLQAPAGEQEEVIKKLRDTSGYQYTDALAHAIHRLTGPVKAKARDALADRLTRMKPTTLTDKLKDDDLEVRRAAALAVAMKDDKTNVGRLIELLEDPEPPVTRAAYAALKSLTNQDFGPDAEASRADVVRAVAAWKDWWSKNGGK
jgi:hypothetical protein